MSNTNNSDFPDTDIQFYSAPTSPIIPSLNAPTRQNFTFQTNNYPTTTIQNNPHIHDNRRQNLFSTSQTLFSSPHRIEAGGGSEGGFETTESIIRRRNAILQNNRNNTPPPAMQVRSNSSSLELLAAASSVTQSTREMTSSTPAQRMFHQASAVAAALSRAQQVHTTRLDQVASTLSRAHQLHSTAQALRQNLTQISSSQSISSERIQPPPRRRTSVANVPNQHQQQRGAAAFRTAAEIGSTNRMTAFLEGFESVFREGGGGDLGVQRVTTTQVQQSRASVQNDGGRSFSGNGNDRVGFEPLFSSRRTSQSNRLSGTVNPSIHPQFRSKVVVKIFCSHCLSEICKRGMKAILLGNTKVELYSTDTPPKGVQLVYQDYTTQNCNCRIRDGACLGCGNVVGYHVTQPCEGCLEACNNGHFWMFHADGVSSAERMDSSGVKILRWAGLPTADVDLDDDEEAGDESPRKKETICR